MKLPKDQILQIFKETDALLEGHFVLTSGLHSPHYFQCAKVLQYPKYLHLLAGDIAKHYEYSEVEVVVSPAVGGIVVCTEVGRVLGVRTIFAERENGDMKLRRGFGIRKGERVLVVEDVVTTGGSVDEVCKLVTNAGATLVGIGCIVDRSNGKAKFDAKFYSVMEMVVQTYTAEEIPESLTAVPITKPGSRGLQG
ncbi:MAG: orotate phosphoribosyltransferase [Bacteriovoracaceae bacterium]|nr:orotate phosphoribosyltransferase [Bacteroidota bacterium]